MAVDRAKERKVADSPELGRQDREVQELYRKNIITSGRLKSLL